MGKVSELQSSTLVILLTMICLHPLLSVLLYRGKVSLMGMVTAITVLELPLVVMELAWLLLPN